MNNMSKILYMKILCLVCNKVTGCIDLSTIETTNNTYILKSFCLECNCSKTKFIKSNNKCRYK